MRIFYLQKQQITNNITQKKLPKLSLDSLILLNYYFPPLTALSVLFLPISGINVASTLFSCTEIG